MNVISVTSSDRVKNPITIFFKGKGKGKEDKEIVKQADSIIIFSDNGWMQGPTTVYFLKKNFKGEEKEVLIWNSYKCHYQGEDILKMLEDQKLLKVIIS